LREKFNGFLFSKFKADCNRVSGEVRAGVRHGSIIRKEHNYEETTMWGKDATGNAVSGIGDL
jgi:hypothetical protein